jgi:quinoprotein glucose dehydrogenase
MLADVTISGKAIKVVAVPSKQAFLYVFDRVSGQPVWPIEERAVPAGDIPGEWYSPTQPFPTKPAPYDRQGVAEDDLLDWTPEIKHEALRIARLHKIGPLFTPPVVRGTDGKAGMLMLPNLAGGSNWSGGGVDPETGIAYVHSSTAITRLSMVSDPTRSNMNYIAAGAGGGQVEGGFGGAPDGPSRAQATPPAARGAPVSMRGAGGVSVNELPPMPPLAVFGLPLVKPPYGRITAIDLNTGEHVWMTPIGDTPDSIKNHPMLKGMAIPRTGRFGRLGPLITKTLLWAGEPGSLVTVDGQQGSWFRSYDKATGAIVSEILLPANTTGVPMTYLHNKKQYIVAAVSAQGRPAELVALALP